MKKIYLLAFALGAFSFAGQAQAEYSDNFDSYNLGPLSPQSQNWRTWSGSSPAAEDAQVSDDESRSPDNSIYIDGSTVTDAIFLTPSAPTSGVYTIQWYTYIPSGKSGYFNMQGALTPDGQDWNQALLGGNVYLNCDGSMPGQGGVTGVTDCSQFDVTFSYPEDEWFKITCIYDLDAQTWSLSINDIEQFNSHPLAFGSMVFAELAGIDFYSASSNNQMYIDDFTAGAGILSTENFSPDVFSVYPNPVKDILNISSKVAVD